MKILLVGEASGVHLNIKRGLQELGHVPVHYIQYKSQQGRSNDGYFAPDLPGVLGGIARNIAPLSKVISLHGFDVVNFVNTITAIHGKYSKYLDLPIFRRKASLLSYYAVGCDELGLIRRSVQDFDYTPCRSCLKSGELLGRDCENHLNKLYDVSRVRAKKYFDCAAVSNVEYDHVLGVFHPDMTARIPLPVNVGSIKFEPAKVKRKIKIAHTPTRRGFKGTAEVMKAVELLSKERSDFEFVCVEGLDYNDYMSVMCDVDVVIDQVYSQSPGINALEMMAAGKIVLTGATAKGRSYYEFMTDFPGLDADPEPSALCRTLSQVIDNKNDFPALAEEGRAYVARHHCYVTIAKKFVELWSRSA